MKKVYLALEQIETEGLQTRVQINHDILREYAEAETERGAVFPPVTVFSDGQKYWLADGFHRVAMARQQGKKKVSAEVHDGGFVEALTWALSANAEHGLRRSNADKGNAVKIAYKNRLLLGLGEVPTANAVAKLVGVSNHCAEIHLGNFPTWRDATARTGADGKTYSLPPPPTRRPVTQVPDSQPEPATEGAPLLPPPPIRNTLPPPPVRAPQTPPPPVRTVPADDPAMTDGRGVPIPPELAEIWNRRKEVADLARLIGQARTAVKASQAGNDPLWAELNHSSAQAHLDRAYAEIAAAMPWCVCPMCRGIGCRACKGRGLLGEARFEAVVPRELRGYAPAHRPATEEKRHD
jgi:hypothetical protein